MDGTTQNSRFDQQLGELSQNGYTLLHGVFGDVEMKAVASRLCSRLSESDEASVLRSTGHVYGARNLLEVFPELCRLLIDSPLREFANADLGVDGGIVRALYFDKHPDRSWSLPWHRDRTIAVKRNDLPSQQFNKPTQKADVPHVEAPRELLERMLTLRVHLDAMGEENGPLCVVPESHREGDPKRRDPVELRAEVGDVLAMRPLLSHSSKMPVPATTAHRRVIHIELAPCSKLSDGYEWYWYTALIDRGKI